MKYIGFAVLIGLLTSLNLAAQERPQPTTFGHDDRTIADSTKPPWRSIGRVNHVTGSYAFHCTGSLVAPNLVLTSAGCLFNWRTEQLLQPNQLHFIAGYMREKFIGHSKVSCIHIHPGYSAGLLGQGEGALTNAAVLVLEKSIKAAPLQIADERELKIGSFVTHAGYGGDRSYVLSVHQNCKVQWIENQLVGTDCDTVIGQGGGPILVQKDGAWELAAIMTAGNEKTGTGGASSASWRDLPNKTTCDK